jgi:hypothetical protein
MTSPLTTYYDGAGADATDAGVYVDVQYMPVLERGSLAATGLFLAAASLEIAATVRKLRAPPIRRAAKLRLVAFSALFVLSMLTSATAAAVYAFSAPNEANEERDVDAELRANAAAVVYGSAGVVFSLLQATKSLCVDAPPSDSDIGAAGEQRASADDGAGVALLAFDQEQQRQASFDERVRALEEGHAKELQFARDELADARNSYFIMRVQVRDALLRLAQHLCDFISQDSQRMSLLQADRTWLERAKDEIADVADLIEKSPLTDLSAGASASASSRRKARRSSTRNLAPLNP